MNEAISKRSKSEIVIPVYPGEKLYWKYELVQVDPAPAKPVKRWYRDVVPCISQSRLTQ